MPRQFRRLMVALPKSPKCALIDAPKIKKVALLKLPKRVLIDTLKIRPCGLWQLHVEYKFGRSKNRVLLLVLVGIDMCSTILCSYSIFAMMYAHSSSYIKDNDHKYGVIIMFHDPKTLQVIGLQCRFWIAFGREDNVTSKHKTTTKVQGWFAPFRYDNIDNHMRTQHGTKWLEYDAIHSNSDCNQFFTDVFVVFKTLIKTHFVSEYVGNDRLFLTSTKTSSKLSLVT